MAVIIPSPHRIQTGKGDYLDIEANMINVVKRALEDNPALSRFSHIEFMNVDPNLVAIKKVPAFFVWCDGSQMSSAEVGGLSTRSLSRKEDFYCTIELVHSGADEYENATEIKHAGHEIKEAIYSNLNLNDSMNHSGEVFECTFSPKPFEIGGAFNMMQGFSVKVRYSKTTRKKQSRR